MVTGYRVLCGVVGASFLLAGLAFFASFFAFHVPDSDPAIPTGPVGFYWVGTAGAALVAWAGCLLGASRRPGAGRAIGTATACGLVLLALLRIAAWAVGDYSAWVGDVPRWEALGLLAVALAFVWLRPPAAQEVTR